MDINIRDNRESTPLHWACYSMSEIALNYLLTMNPDLDAADQKGFTPLHLAVKSVAQLKSTRPVRALLLKGANRQATDLEGKTAVDMIGKDVPEGTRLDIENMLTPPSYLECLMIKTPLTPLKPNHKTQIVLTLILGLVTFTFWTIIYPRKFHIFTVTYNIDQDHLYQIIIQGALTLAVLISYITASAKDPGILRPE